MIVSNSEIQAFKGCRRRWYLSYYLNLGTPEADYPPTGSMHIGTRVHEALEAMYSNDSDPVEVLNMIYRFDASRFEGDPAALEAISKDRDLATLMVAGYVQWLADEGIDEDLEVVAPEATVTVPSGIQGVELTGKLDLRARVRSSGAQVFVDHKTVGDLTSPLQTIEINEQFKTYGLLERLMSTDDTTWSQGGMINMLRRVKRTVRSNPPFYAREIVKHNDHELRSMWKRVHEVINQMLVVRARLDRGGDHQAIAYPTPSSYCSWGCQFLKVCAMMDDGSRFEDALDENYVKIDPYARYREPSLRVKAAEWAVAQKEAS